MPFTVNMPKLSPTMEEGTIAEWHKKEGDFVEEGELLLEITTDKATIEHSALDEGYLRKILVPEGETARLNEPIALFTATKDENIKDFKLSSKETEKQPSEQQAPATKETERHPPSEKAPATQFLQPSFVPEPPLEAEVLPPPSHEIIASPLAKKLAKEKGLDLSTVAGTGPGGRITSRDLEKAQPAGKVSFGDKPLPKHPAGSFEEHPLTPMRKVIGRRLQESKTFIPHFYTTQVIDADPMVTFREQLKEVNIKVTYNDIVLRALALTLKEHPTLNAGFNSVKQSLIAFKTVDISLAVTVDAGLITPIIRHADQKNLGELAAEAKFLINKARQGKLQEHEYKGGSFTLSNLGMFGISSFTGVINPPQAAILAVGGIAEVPVVKQGKVVCGKQMAVTLSADHRVVDGADAAKFLVTLKHLLENPAPLAIG